MPLVDTSADQVEGQIGAQHDRLDLHAHCRRMLGSPDDAEDAVQETYLRAWRSRATFAGDAAVRTWLYRIATNVCLDMLRARSRTWRANGGRPVELLWFGGADDPAEEIPSDDDGPDTVVVARETVELAVLVAARTLPARQRDTLILRDVLGRSAAEAAADLGTSVAASNSALQRARDALREHMPRRTDWALRDASADEQALVDRVLDAHGRQVAVTEVAAPLAS